MLVAQTLFRPVSARLGQSSGSAGGESVFCDCWAWSVTNSHEFKVVDSVVQASRVAKILFPASGYKSGQGVFSLRTLMFIFAVEKLAVILSFSLGGFKTFSLSFVFSSFITNQVWISTHFPCLICGVHPVPGGSSLFISCGNVLWYQLRACLFSLLGDLAWGLHVGPH